MRQRLSAVSCVVFMTLAFAGCQSSPPAAPAPPAQASPAFMFIAGLTPSLVGTAPFDAIAILSDGVPSIVTSEAVWSSSNPAVLRVTADGQVTAVSFGSAVLKAVYKNFTDETEIETRSLPCVLSVQPSQISVPRAGGSATFNVVYLGNGGDNCPWEAKSRNTFLTIPGASTGRVQGSVTVMVSPNTGGPRTGYVTAGRKLVTISQN